MSKTFSSILIILAIAAFALSCIVSNLWVGFALSLGSGIMYGLGTLNRFTSNWKRLGLWVVILTILVVLLP